ncbi:MAG: MerR family transcriptional regulator [Acidobacteria bacterium]|nr:MerR family transcriptional regulator [Acidobacteriota bacterium]
MEKKQYKISELVKITGVPKSTILYYVNKGLLPEPVKTSPNMAWYSEDCVEKIKFIKDMQARRFVPLAHIKRVLHKYDECGASLQSLLNLNRTVFNYKSPDDKEFTKKQFIALPGISEEFLNELEELNFIIPMEEGDEKTYGQEDYQQYMHLKNLAECNIHLPDLAYYPELIGQMVKKDMEIHHKATDHLKKEDGDMSEFVQMTEKMSEAARASRQYLFDRLFSREVVLHAEEHLTKIIINERKDEEK